MTQLAPKKGLFWFIAPRGHYPSWRGKHGRRNVGQLVTLLHNQKKSENKELTGTRSELIRVKASPWGHSSSGTVLSLQKILPAGTKFFKHLNL